MSRVRWQAPKITGAMFAMTAFALMFVIVIVSAVVLMTWRVLGPGTVIVPTGQELRTDYDQVNFFIGLLGIFATAGVFFAFYNVHQMQEKQRTFEEEMQKKQRSFEEEIREKQKAELRAAREEAVRVAIEEVKSSLRHLDRRYIDLARRVSLLEEEGRRMPDLVAWLMAPPVDDTD